MEGAFYLYEEKMDNANKLYFDEILKKLSPVLKRITYKLNGHFTFFSEDDLYQQALLHLWLDYQGGKLSDKTDSYILQGCYFYLKNYIRMVQDKARLISLDAPVREENFVSEYNGLCLEDPEPYRDNTFRKMLIEDILNGGLTKREKEVFSFYLEGFTTREIGEKLGISHARVVKLEGKIKIKCQKFRD